VLATLVPPEVVTSTLAVPALPTGVVQATAVSLTTVTFVAAVPPMLTLAGEAKPVPVMVTPRSAAQGRWRE